MHSIHQALEGLAVGTDLIGISLMVWGFGRSLLQLVGAEARSSQPSEFLMRTRAIRCGLGTYLLLGLEFMILSDIIQSALSRTLIDLAFLAAIVAIRTTIAFFLGRELAELRTA